MGLGEWGRIATVAAVGLGGLLLVREDVLTADQLGVLMFILALFTIYRFVTHHFNKRDGGRR